MDNVSAYSAPREPGTRRKKLAGYLKAANELRQSYLGGTDGESDAYDASMPGSYTDGTVVRHGDEELLLFPSYARRHQPRQKPREKPGTQEDLRNAQSAGDAEYWRREWDQYEDENAIVDVDTRGWIYAPQRGQMTRKNRIMVGIARKLSGVPAPASSRSSSPSSPHHARVEARAAKQEEELAEKEAQSIEKTGKAEGDIAQQGGYNEAFGGTKDPSSIESSPGQSRTSSPDTRLPRPRSTSSLRSIQKRSSWNQPSEMTSEELSTANSHLMVRLRPFLHVPLMSTPLTVFFYNDKTSKSRTTTSNDAGHFSLRAALDFIPTHVRVLASDKLSASEEVHITEPKGVSLISDIDDTIKHSAIGAGAREIFRNAFIRELADLTIEGVKEWYTTMADMGVKLHYVSNSPWQFYPVLTSYFAAAGLPKGSFHLKQYTGMLQGIFEPVAERKRPTLDRIMTDFPDRRFILVGDSGEADLELYTDILLENPGRILAVFIRDVTTDRSRGFFDSSGHSQPFQQPPSGSRSDNNVSSSKTRAGPVTEQRPVLPPRPSARASSTLAAAPSPPEQPETGKLIDFDEEVPSQTAAIEPSNSDPSQSGHTSPSGSSKSPPPPRPAKPPALRRPPTASTYYASNVTSPITRKPAPPPPPKPRKSSATSDTSKAPPEPSPLSQIQNVSSPPPPSTSDEPYSYRSAVKNSVASAYNSLPAWNVSSAPYSQSSTSSSNTRYQGPPVPSRRNISSYPSNTANGNDDAYGGTYDPVISKKEELWNRRWERARLIFKEKGVLLRSWRVGEDVADECVRLAEKALKQNEKPR